MAKNDDEFKLDYHGGTDKIRRAQYSPQAYRQENRKLAKGRRWSLTIAVCIGLALALAVRHFGI